MFSGEEKKWTHTIIYSLVCLPFLFFNFSLVAVNYCVENNKWQGRRQSSWNNNKNYLWKERHAETFIQPLWRTILVNYSIFIDYLLYWVSYVGMWSCFPEHAGCFGRNQQDTGGNQLIWPSPIANSILSLVFLLSI